MGVVVGTEPETKPGDGPGPTVFGAVERLLAAAAVFGAALYVLVNALYIEFYDDFGVRPEQVGFDRLAVVARSAWVALLAIVLLGPVAWLLARRASTKAKEEHREDMNRRVAAEVAEYQAEHGADDAIQVLGEERRRAAQSRAMEMELASMRREQNVYRLRFYSLLVIATSLSLLALYWALAYRVDTEADRVAHGQSSNGLGIVVPFIDVRASQATAKWIDPDAAAPAGLEDAPFLTYLGDGDGVAVLVACGDTTYVVPDDAVSITLLNQGRNKLSDDEEQKAFDDACN